VFCDYFEFVNTIVINCIKEVACYLRQRKLLVPRVLQLFSPRSFDPSSLIETLDLPLGLV